jgi:hypothetical protein
MYKGASDFLGYNNQVCHDAHALPEIMEVFDPDIIFWLHPRSGDIDNLLRKYRQDNSELSVIWVIDGPHGSFGNDTSRDYDHFFNRVVIPTDQFQKTITEWFLESMKNDPSNSTKQRFLFNLSDNALRVVASEQMWSSDKSYMENLLERDKRGKLDRDEKKILEELIQIREQLMKRKAKAASILIDRGYSGSLEELIAESKRLD